MGFLDLLERSIDGSKALAWRGCQRVVPRYTHCAIKKRREIDTMLPETVTGRGVLKTPTNPISHNAKTTQKASTGNVVVPVEAMAVHPYADHLVGESGRRRMPYYLSDIKPAKMIEWEDAEEAIHKKMLRQNAENALYASY